jgi:hypothetical protein
MANDMVPGQPATTPGIWDKVIEAIGDANLPKLIAGPAGEALARLIAGGADIPAAWLQQKAQAIKDKTEAQSLMTKTLAGAAAELVKSDPALVQRAAEAFIAKEIGHQHNRERIAIKAIEHLKETPDAQTTKPDDDWLNMFARHAQEASSDRLQDLWGQILSGQLRKPRSFSLQTLRFVSELDEPMVRLFEKWSPSVVDGEFIPNPPNQGPEFSELLQLEDFGLMAGVTTQLSRTFNDLETEKPELATVNFVFEYKDYHMIVTTKRPASVHMRISLLTRVGREIYSITKTRGSLEPIKIFSDHIPKYNVEQIACVSRKPAIGETPVILWSKPPEQPAEPQPQQ